VIAIDRSDGLPAGAVQAELGDLWVGGFTLGFMWLMKSRENASLMVQIILSG